MDSPVPVDPSVFQPEAVSAETREFNEQLAKRQASAARPYEQAEIRPRAAAGRTNLGLPIVRLDWAEDRYIPGPACDIPLRVFVPDTVRGVYLHFHGGGHNSGGQDWQDPDLARTATASQVAVVSVGYRLAPEHKYPAGPDDCEAVALWLAKNAKSEFGTDRLVIGGGSAGATLSASTLLRMRDRHRFTGFRGAQLNCGCYDFSATPSAAGCGEDSLVLNPARLNAVRHDYLPEGVDARDPDLSVLYADLKDMPPALFTVGTLDPLLDDSLFMYARWLAAGNEAKLAVYPGGVHAFNAFPIDIGKQANARIDEFMRRAVVEQE